MKDRWTGLNVKQKLRIKVKQSGIVIYLPKGITKNYNTVINGKKFHDQTIDSDIRRYKATRKLTPWQSEDYTTECMLDYEYIKNYYRLLKGMKFSPHENFAILWLRSEIWAIEIPRSSKTVPKIREIRVPRKFYAAKISCFEVIATDLSEQKELHADLKAIQQIEFVMQLKKIDNNGNATDIGDEQNMFVLTTLEKPKKQD